MTGPTAAPAPTGPAGAPTAATAPAVSSGSRSEHDVVVIGAGLAGLSTAALLAAAGFDVALLERNSFIGGYAQSFERDGLRFDPAVHFTLDAGPGGYIPRLLDHLAVADRVDFVATPEMYRAYYPDRMLDAPAGREEYLASLCATFPASAAGLRELFATRAAAFEQLSALPQKVGTGGLEAALAAAPLVFEHRMSTLGDVVNSFVDDPVCAAAFGSFWPYIGLPPSEVSFLLANQMLETMHRGTYYARGTFGTLADALGEAITRHGGVIHLDSPVESVVADETGVTVRTTAGADLRARAVVGAIDARTMLGDLIGWDLLPPKLRKRVDRMSLAPSAIVTFGTLNADPTELGLVSETLIFDTTDHDATRAAIRSGTPGGTWISVPTLVDPPAAGEPHRATITSLVPAVADGTWADRKDAVSAEILAGVERHLPGFDAAFTPVEIATPDTLYRYSGNTGGATYGWANSPQQTASKRLPHRPGLPGVYLAGHWVEEGFSSLRTLTSGRATAAMVAADLGKPEAIPDFGGPSFLRSDR